jgi:hypothetical protein
LADGAQRARVRRAREPALVVPEALEGPVVDGDEPEAGIGWALPADGEPRVERPDLQPSQPVRIGHVEAEGHDGAEQRHDGGREEAVAALQVPGLLPGQREGALGLRPPAVLEVAPAPVQDGRGEDVVVELAADRAVLLGRRDRSQDAPALQPREGRLDRVGRRLRELRELVRRQRDLAPAGRDEEAERVGRRVALLVGQLRHRIVEVRAHDRVGPAEAPQRLAAQPRRSSGDLLVPDPLHDELQVRGLDPVGARVGRAVLADGHAPAADPLQDGVDELVLDLARHVAGRHAQTERLQRLHDRQARRPLVEEVEVQVVAVDVGDPRLEPLADEGVRVLADGDEEVRTQVAVDDAVRQLVVEPAGVLRGVQEVLLELVEDEQDRGVRRGARVLHRQPQGVVAERGRLAIAHGPSCRRLERRDHALRRVRPPAAEDHRDEAEGA